MDSVSGAGGDSMDGVSTDGASSGGPAVGGTGFSRRFAELFQITGLTGSPARALMLRNNYDVAACVIQHFDKLESGVGDHWIDGASADGAAEGVRVYMCVAVCCSVLQCVAKQILLLNLW